MRAHATLRHRRLAVRGQVIPLVAIAAVVLLGTAALAVDLSVQTHDERSLQNTSDAAALSGAQDLPAAPAAADQYQGAQDALQIIRKRMGWQSLLIGGSPVTNTGWASTLASSCGPGVNTTSPPSCNITKTVCSNVSPAPSDLPATCDSKTSLGANAHYFSITVQTPPRTSNVPSVNGDLRYFEVTITQDTQNYISGALGMPISKQASRSTAYHLPPNQPFGFALYAKTVVATQNKSSLVIGDVYAARNVNPQANGQAGFCASGGLIVLGSPQLPQSYDQKNDPGQADIKPDTAHPIQTLASCGPGGTNLTINGTVNQTRNPASGCSVSGASFNATFDTDPQIRTCVANPPITLPGMPQPTRPTGSQTCVTATAATPASPGQYSSGPGNSCKSGTALTISSSGAVLNPGVYEVAHNPGCNPTSCYDVDISASLSLTGVTFWLDTGATLGVHGVGTTVSINPNGSGTGLGDNRYPIYSDSGAVSQVYVVDNGANLDLFGTMYIPDGVAHTSSNAFFQIDGQAIVGTWDDQGGNHTTADITYDAGRNTPQNEVLRLVE